MMNAHSFHSLIQNFKKIQDHKYSVIKELIDNFDYKSYLTKKKKEDFEKTKNLITQFKETEIFKNFSKFDIFKVLKFKPVENQISDVIAEFLKIDNFKKDVIKMILREVVSNYQNFFECIDKLKPSDIKIVREYSGDGSRIDIRIYATNKFVIDIEMKVEGGAETVVNGIKQTDREWEALEKFAKRINAEHNKLALFVAPYGYYPTSEKFEYFPLQKLSKIITKIIEKEIENFPDDIEKLLVFYHFFSSKYIF